MATEVFLRPALTVLASKTHLSRWPISDHDGNSDLIGTCIGADQNSNVAVLLGNGDGTFQPAISYRVGSFSSAPSSIDVGDFNGDGKLDLAVANAGDNRVNILLGNGNGSFQPAVSFPAG